MHLFYLSYTPFAVSLFNQDATVPQSNITHFEMSTVALDLPVLNFKLFRVSLGSLCFRPSIDGPRAS